MDCDGCATCQAPHLLAYLTPNNKISGGQLPSSKTQPSANRAAAILRRAASLSRGASALGAYCRRRAYGVGRAKAITATAGELTVLVYRVLRGEITCHDPGAAAYQQHNRPRVGRNLPQRAQQPGFAAMNIQTDEVLCHTASKRVASLQVSYEQVRRPRAPRIV
jgi:hypothetical protein